MQLSFAEDILKRVERLENQVKPVSPRADVDGWRPEAMESAHELSGIVETLAAEVADIGNRLERIECLLMCSDLSHIKKIDNVLRQLKKDAIEQTAEDSERCSNNYGSLDNKLETDLQKSHLCYTDKTEPTAGVIKVWPSKDVRQEEQGDSPTNLKRDFELDFVPLCSGKDLATAPACTQHAMDKLDVKETTVNNIHAQPKQMPIEVNQKVAFSEKCIEQISSGNPVRFWRDGQGNEARSDTALKVIDESSQRLVKEPLASDKRVPRKQGKSTGWNLAAEAASSGKRIDPKQSRSTGWNLAAEAASSGKRIEPKQW